MRTCNIWQQAEKGTYLQPPKWEGSLIRISCIKKYNEIIFEDKAIWMLSVIRKANLPEW